MFSTEYTDDPFVRCRKCHGIMKFYKCPKCESAPAQEEKEMVCIDCGAVECSDVPICDECNDARRKRCDRTADLRQLWDKAYFAALTGACTYDTCIDKMVVSAERYANETIRRHADMMASRDELIAEVVG